MKHRPSTEGNEIVKKDYRKKIIFSLIDLMVTNSLSFEEMLNVAESRGR